MNGPRAEAIAGFTKALTAGFSGEDIDAYVEGTIEGYFACGPLTVTSHPYTWETTAEMRRYVSAAERTRKPWKRHTVLSLRERFRGHIEIADPDGYTVVLQPVYTDFRWDYTTIEAGSYYRTPGTKIIGWTAYDEFYLHRKPWKLKTDAHLDFLLASIGYRRG